MTLKLELTVLQPFPWPDVSQDRHNMVCVKDNIKQPCDSSNFKISCVTPCLGNSYDMVEFTTAWQVIRKQAATQILHGMIEPILWHSLVLNKDRGSHFQQEMCCGQYKSYSVRRRRRAGGAIAYPLWQVCSIVACENIPGSKKSTSTGWTCVCSLGIF